MNYADWIIRERRLRVMILRTSPVIKERGTQRVCLACGEVLLCHEEACPDCNAAQIGEVPLFDLAAEAKNRVRCRHRYETIYGNTPVA